ncbi:LOW QUALITY PROTEIN: protein transport protein Sec24C [Osmerus eperlanus]|uniref:LOW QUALITY PROTEIN: protein transport protein Sec24C n=1 Tax=Osmerus eperlanus TaxID=29151 RepID=UPI002E11A433
MGEDGHFAIKSHIDFWPVVAMSEWLVRSPTPDWKSSKASLPPLTQPPAEGGDPSHPPDMGQSPTQGSWSTRPIQRCPAPPVWSQSPSSPVQPAWSPSSPVQPGWSPSSPVQPGWSPSSPVQPAWSPSCPVKPGWSPSSPVQQQPLLASPQQPYTGAGYAPDTASHPCRGQSLEEASTHPPCLSPGETGVTSSPSSESRYGLQPQLLPSAVKVMEDDRAEWEGRVFVSELGSSLPPLATTECITEDRGNARPGYMRATSYCVPCEGPMALLSHLPLGALVTPLALPGPQERPLPVSSEGECVRGCGACGAYMCPAVTWQDCAFWKLAINLILYLDNNAQESLFQPLDSDVSLAKKCVNQGCGLHLFAFCQQDVGGAWPGHVPYLTGGALRSYDSLLGELERERFGRDLRMSVETETGYRAQIKIFVSKDMRVSGCYGSFVPGPSPSKVALATLDWRTTLAIELSHSRAVEEKRGVVIQVVLSYTSERGERRTRVHTLTLRCSRHLLDTFRHCQAQSLLTFYCKKMYCSALERPLQELREELQTEVTEALACYRKHCSSTSVSPGQLVLPQHLRVLPVYINSLRKSEVLLPAQRCSVHTRLALRSQLVAMDTASTARHFYPLLLPLQTGCGDIAGDASGPSLGPALRCSGASLGPALRCSGASLDPGGLYLASSPLSLLLWVGHAVPSHALGLLFNTRCLASLPSGETKLPVLDNPLSISVRSLLQTLGSQGPSALKLVVVKQGDSGEESLQSLLVEDKSPNGGASYADFLYHLHVNSLRLLV